MVIQAATRSFLASSRHRRMLRSAVVIQVLNYSLLVSDRTYQRSAVYSALSSGLPTSAMGPHQARQCRSSGSMGRPLTFQEQSYLQQISVP